MLVSFTETNDRSIYRFASTSDQPLLDLAESTKKTNQDAEIRFSSV